MKNNSNLEFRKIKSLKFLYEVNENGTIFRNVKSKKQSKIKLDFHHSKSGYYTTFVRIGGRRPEAKTIRVPIHKVIAECWLGDKPDGYEIDHIDRNSHNNHYSNLRYVTKSEQMKNRDHSNISKKGTINCQNWNKSIMKPIIIKNNNEEKYLESIAECARYLSTLYNVSFDHIRTKLKARRSHIYDYDIIYLNAETKRNGSKEQEIVHKSDLVGTTDRWNSGKLAELKDRIIHDIRN